MISLNTSTIHKVLQSGTSMMGITRTKQGAGIYKHHLHIHIHPRHTKCRHLAEARWLWGTVIIAQLSSKWPCGNSSTSAHDVCDVQWASSLYIKTCWQSSMFIYVQLAGVILETKDKICQSSNAINSYCFIAI